MSQPFIKVFSIVFVLFSFASCGKKADQPTAPIDIRGNWKLVNIRTKSSETIEEKTDSFLVKKVVVSDGITEKNSGIIEIDSSAIVLRSLGYERNSLTKIYVYHDGKPFDTVLMAPSRKDYILTGMMTYKRIGADSLFFDSPSYFIGGMTLYPPENGAKFKMQNGKLLLIISGVYLGTGVNGILPNNIVQDSAIYTFQKE